MAKTCGNCKSLIGFLSPDYYELDDEDVEIHLFSNKILFKYKNIIFQSRLLNGNYPNTTNLIPNEFAYIIKVSWSWKALNNNFN